MHSTLDDLVKLATAADKLQSASDALLRVLREEAAWWAAGCQARDTEARDETRETTDA